MDRNFQTEINFILSTPKDITREGFHCIAPFQRGYGGTSKPDDVNLYQVDFLVGKCL